MPPKNPKKRTYSNRVIQDENNQFNNIEKRFKKIEEEPINIQRNTCQTRSKTKLDIDLQIKLSEFQQEELKKVQNKENNKVNDFFEDLLNDLEIKNKFEISELDKESLIKKSLEYAAKSYHYENTKNLLIDPKLITFNYLNDDRYPLINRKLLILKEITNVRIIKEIFDNYEKYLRNRKIIYLLGPSGIGKSYSLIQTIFEIKQNKSDKFRIIHIIFNRDYVLFPNEKFCYDFLYCFVNDFHDPEFPLPPESQTNNDKSQEAKVIAWFNYLFDCRETNSFLKIVKNYLEKKNIKFILIWDQDNVYQNNKVKILASNSFHFLNSIILSIYVDFRIVSISNNNEGFQDLNEMDQIIEINSGFNQSESLLYMKILKIINKINFSIKESEIYDLTNGNCFLINQFMNEKGNSYEEKYNLYIENMERNITGNVAKYFSSMLNSNKEWDLYFSYIPFYLDSKCEIPIYLIKFADKNYTFIENKENKKFLKSVNLLSKKYFLNYYYKQLSNYDRAEISFIEMEKIIIDETNASLKGMLFEKFLLEKISYYTNRDIQCKYNYKSNRKDVLKLKFSSTEHFHSNNEMNKFIKKSNNNLLLIPISHKYPNFNFAFWDKSVSKLYVFQIRINIINDKKSDEYFFENLKKFQVKSDQIQFIWTGYDEKKENKLLWNHIRDKSWFLDYKEIKFPQ